MGNEYRAKVFKSGNSVALRLPKALGLKEGDELMLREHEGSIIVEPAIPQRRTIDLTSIWGACPDLVPLTPEQRMFDSSPRVCDDHRWDGLEERVDP